jgi:hypothetical protein
MPDNDQEIKDHLLEKFNELAEKEVIDKAKRDDFMARMQKKMQIELMKVQQACSHRKGQAWAVPTPDINSESFLKFEPKLPLFVFDFCVIMHTFVDGKQMIKCVMCNRTWYNTDPDFPEALKMVEASSNKPSASERLINGATSALPPNIVTYVTPLKKSFWKRFWIALTTPNERKALNDAIEEFKGDDNV